MAAHPDITQLARFLAIAETGSFRAAAKRLRISQPTLSWSMQQLEESLGATLIERGARGANVTKDGERLLPRAKLIVSEAARTVGDFAALKGERESSLAVGVAPMFINAPVPSAMAATLAQIPNLNIRVLVRFSVDLIEALKEGDIDLGFGGKPPHADTSGISFEPIYQQRYALVARAQHPIFKLKRITDRSALDYKWVMFDSVRIVSFESGSFRAKGLPLPHIAVRSSSMSYIRGMVLHSDLIGYMATDYVGDEIRTGALREVPNTLMGYTAPVGILTREGSVQTAAMKAFKSEIRAACKALSRRKR